jgi:nicotinic acid mononucleotide adenylyltransferase
MIITDLEKHFEETDGERAILTGTFDPPHIGHTVPVRVGVRKLYPAKMVVIPHSWAKEKSPVRINTRIRWMIETLQEFAPDLHSNTAIVFDPSIIDNRERFDELCKEYRDRIIRVIGNDKDAEKIRNKNKTRVMVTHRPACRSSSIIRDSICGGKISQVQGYLAKSVLDEILESGCYWQI